jgi:hypothetical protein
MTLTKNIGLIMLVSKPKAEEFENEKIKISKDVKNQVLMYLDWNDTLDVNNKDDFDFFINEALKHTLESDKSFKKFLKELPKK